MSAIQQNRYDALLRRVADLKGPGSKVNDALTELFPMIDVENVPGELLILGGTDICFGAGSLTSAVGESPRVQVFNPADSGKIATVTSCVISVLVLTTLRWTVSLSALSTGVGVQRFRDSRRGATRRPTCGIFQQSSVAQTDSVGRAILDANRSLTLEDPNGIAVLAPGTGFEVGTTSTNDRIDATFNWRERVAEPSELQL